MARNLASGAGFLLIMVPAFLYSPDTSFPGLSALPPCLGAALIIYAGETPLDGGSGRSLVAGLLSWTPVRFIGLISYSLYLWHWPIIVFQDAGGMLVKQTQWPERLIKLLVAVVAILVATLSWRYVEQPFRKGKWRPRRAQLFAGAAAATAAIAVMGVAMLVRDGFPQRLPPDARQMAKYLAVSDAKPAGRLCFLLPENSFADYQADQCLAAQPGKPSILIAGDSHSAMLTPAFAAVYPDRSILQASASDCPPLVAPVAGRHRSENCTRLFDFLFNDYLLHHHVDTLVLVARWRESDIPGINATLAYTRAHGIRTVIVGPSIEYDTPAARLLAVALWKGDVQDVAAHQLAAPRELDQELSGLAEMSWRVPYLSIFDDLCKPDCPLYAEGSAPLVFDGNHLSPAGSLLLAKRARAASQLP